MKKIIKKPALIIKKPTLKFESHSATRVIQGLAKEQAQLIREVESPYVNPVQYNRSLFFRQTFKEERRKDFGGFL